MSRRRGSATALKASEVVEARGMGREYMPIWEYVKQKLIDRSERPRGVLPSLPHRTLTLAATLLVTVTRLREARRLAERERDESLADMRCRKEIAERVGRLRVDTQ